MSQTIKLKRSGVQGKVPTVNQLSLGEIAMNTYDGKIFFAVSQSGITHEIRNIITTNTTFPITGSLYMNGNITASSINIGYPSDGLYTDGFFDTFNSGTTVANAIDEISEAFLDLAPAKAGLLTSTDLTKNNPSTFAGYLSNGLNSEWYVNYSAYDYITVLSSNTSVELLTADASTRFRAGKNSDISSSLVGGVRVNRIYGVGSVSQIDARNLSDGVGYGTNNNIYISDISQYNTFWAKANAKIFDTISSTGSVRYTIDADNGAGETNEYQLFYCGTTSDFPSQGVSGFTSSLSNITYNYLSGIEYYKTADILLSMTGSNLYNPVHNRNQVQLTSTYISNYNTGSNTPTWSDTLFLDTSTSLSSNLSSGQSLGVITATMTKPNKSNVTSNTNIGSIEINSYTSPQSTNNSDTQIEKFLDEAYRMSDLQTNSWTSTNVLTDGNLEVQNNRLIAGKYGNYSLHDSGSTDNSEYSNYFRKSDPASNYRQNGTFRVTRNSSAFASTNPISAWNSGGELEVCMVLSSDVTGAESSNIIYDFGRGVGNDSGIIKGIMNTVNTNTSTVYDINWALPSGTNTGLASSTFVIIWVRYRGTSSNDYITQLNINYT